MGGKRIDPKIRTQFWSLLETGHNIRMAAEQCGISYQTALNWTKGEELAGRNWRQRSIEAKLPPPKRRVEGDAKDALVNFDLFRRRYLGRRSTPWQVDAAKRCVDWVNSGETEFAVINCPPGSGKSTLFTHDIPTWLIVRNRNIRIMIGSSNLRMAQKYAGRIRRTLERVRPVENASGVLAYDYGRFRPEVADVWRQEEFVVLAHDDEPIEDKEPTVSAFGMETEFLGTRANFVVWDDLVTNKTMATPEKIDKLETWWDTEGETRLEPGGLLLLQGQRMGPEDLYQKALGQRLAEEDDEDEMQESSITRYHHILYPAHFEDRCFHDHDKDAKPFPDGCLLDPIRLPWRGKNGLATIMQNKESAYRVQYQQEDVDPENVLVKQIWVDGGMDPSDRIDYPGCYDKDRGYLELPKNLEPPLYSIAVADPSPTKYWAIQWWVVQPATNQRFFMDQVRGVMDAPDFLDWVQATRQYVGLMDEWQHRSQQMGYPISHWVIENNAAQRFLLQYDFAKRWMRMHNVSIVGHSTQGANKLDPDYGIQMLKNVYKHGMCRFPSGMEGRGKCKQLILEATRYPEGKTDDCVMAQWFLEYHIPNISRPAPREVKLPRPKFMRAYA